MAKIIHPSNPAVVEQDATEPSTKKQRTDERPSSAALMLLLLRDGLSSDYALNQTSNGKAHPPVMAMKKKEGAHVSITDDEDETFPHSSITSKRVRPAPTISPVKSAPSMPTQPLGPKPTLFQPPRFLPEGRPLAAPPSLRMPRGFVFRQPASNKL